jgi:hypothetical protein
MIAVIDDHRQAYGVEPMCRVPPIAPSARLPTSGADGQVLTLLQILAALFPEEQDLASTIDRRCWRSENGRLLVEANHAQRRAPASLRLRHDVAAMPDADMRAGAVAAAGMSRDRRSPPPIGAARPGPASSERERDVAALRLHHADQPASTVTVTPCTESESSLAR